MEVEMVVVRHGETESNRSHTIQGHQDTALSDLGGKQAEGAARYLADTDFSLAISSDLIRALKTGQVIAEANPSLSADNIQTWPVLRERCFGEFEGEAASKMTDILRTLNKSQMMEWGPSGGETGQQFRDRVRAFLRDFGERMVKKSDDKPVRRVLVTSHGGLIKELNMVLVADYKCEMPCDHGEYGRISPNTGVTKFLINLDKEGKITSAKCTLLYYKDHLEGIEFHEPLHYGL